MSSVKPPHEASQSGYGGCLGTAGRASSPNQGGVRTGLCDRSAIVDDRSEKTHAVEESNLLH